MKVSLPRFGSAHDTFWFYHLSAWYRSNKTSTYNISLCIFLNCLSQKWFPVWRNAGIDNPIKYTGKISKILQKKICNSCSMPFDCSVICSPSFICQLGMSKNRNEGGGQGKGRQKERGRRKERMIGKKEKIGGRRGGRKWRRKWRTEKRRGRKVPLSVHSKIHTSPNFVNSIWYIWKREENSFFYF